MTLLSQLSIPFHKRVSLQPFEMNRTIAKLCKYNSLTIGSIALSPAIACENNRVYSVDETRRALSPSAADWHLKYQNVPADEQARHYVNSRYNGNYKVRNHFFFESLAPNRRQVIIWTKGGPIYLCKYASLSLNELMQGLAHIDVSEKVDAMRAKYSTWFHLTCVTKFLHV